MLNLKHGINSIIKRCLLASHPVGSYYMSSVSTSPATLFGGGTWERVTDKFLWAAGDNEIGTTGGEKSHTLTVDELPSHNHSINQINNGYLTVSGVRIGWKNQNALGNSAGVRPPDYSENINVIIPAHDTNNKGGGLSHNTMPPYIGVYCWKRTA